MHPDIVSVVGGQRGTDVALHADTLKKYAVRAGVAAPDGCSWTILLR